MADPTSPVPDWSRQVLEHLPVGVACFRGNRFYFVNDALLRMTRLSSEALLAIDPFELLGARESQRIRDRYQARQRGEAPTEAYEITVRRGDGTWTQLEMEPRVTPSGEALLLFRDLSAHRREQVLLGELAALAVRVQQASTQAQMLDAATEGLFRLGFAVGLGRVEGEDCRFERLRGADALMPLVQPLLGKRIPLSHLPGAQTALAERRACYFDDGPSEVRTHLAALGEPLSADLPGQLRKAGADKAAVCPLLVHERPWGLLVVLADGLSAQAAAALSLFSAQLASALQVADTIARLQTQNHRLAAINALAQAANEAEPAELPQRLLQIAIEATQSDGACIFRAFPEKGMLELEAVIGAPDWFAEKYGRLPLAGSVTGETAGSGRARGLTVEDWPEKYREHLIRAGQLVTAVIPLIAKGKLAGTLNLSRSRPVAYSDEDLRACEVLGGQVAVLLERARLDRELRHSYEQLAKTQQELVKRERLAALGELAAVIAHEVRNPLGVVFNSLSSLRRMVSMPDARELLSIVGEESERLNRLVSDLLDFARPNEPKLQPDVLADVAASAVEAAVRGSGIQGLKIRVDVPRELPRVLVDAQLCRQAVLNLILNGAQSMGRAGEVVISARVDPTRGGAVRLDVSDTGAGIAPELADRIFQPFFTTRASGTGLGLALVKRIAEAHQAELTFESRVGQGTTFSIWLPAVSGGALPSHPPAGGPG